MYPRNNIDRNDKICKWCHFKSKGILEIMDSQKWEIECGKQTNTKHRTIFQCLCDKNDRLCQRICQEKLLTKEH